MKNIFYLLILSIIYISCGNKKNQSYEDLEIKALNKISHCLKVKLEGLDDIDSIEEFQNQPPDLDQELQLKV